ncbi:MAG: DUF1223 domain-containing protein [Pelagimonas sp.]
MRKIILWTAALCTVAVGAVQAQQAPVVVELFTSQGCSSCPPADELLAELGQRDDVIPLALHVDYWDYIGWKDVFASPEYTKRQKGYAHAGGWRTIYTPQMVVNGSEDVVGSRPMKVADLIMKHAMAPQKVSLELTRGGNQLTIQAEAKENIGPVEVHIVRYAAKEQVDIRRGENAGRKITYTHVVQDWDTKGRWNGRGSYDTKVRLKGDEPVVVLLQKPGHGEILAAARLR